MKRKPPVASAIEEAVIASLREGHREFLRFVSRQTQNLHDAEDILQDFYLKAIRSARTIKEQGALKGWLAQVLRRTVTDYYRRASVRKAALLRLEIAEGLLVKIDDDAERAVCSCLYRILPTMPSEYAQLIWQVDLLGQPRSKVAKALGISANNLGVRIHRARRALHSALLRFCTTCPTHGFLNCTCEEGQESLKGTSSRSGLRARPTASSGTGGSGGLIPITRKPRKS
jgi:RNA polymerase sigma-70 factor (ECF subfamily)